MGYIDAHVHVWTDDVDSYPLAPGHAVEEMQPPTFTPEELLAHAKPLGVDRVVLIQMSFYSTDNRYMLDAIAARPDTFRGVAVVDHTAGNLADVLGDLRAGGVRGVRIYQLTGADEPSVDSPSYASLCRLAGRLGIAVCPLIDVGLLPALDRAAETYGDTTFVIDHMARVGAGRPIAEPDVDALCALAKRPNCCVKVSAFYALGEAKPPHSDLIPVTRRLVDAYGANRLMWATDCPYQVQSETYDDSLSLVRDRLAFLSDAERQWMLGGTAERVFFGS